MDLELRPSGADPVHTELDQFEWGDPTDHESDLAASIDSRLTQLGPVSAEAIDLARIATAAFIADRQSPRGAGFSRSLHIHVQLRRVARWQPLLPAVEEILHWLSGDQWSVTASSDRLPDGPRRRPAVAHYDVVSLLSGGLDSFSGAVLTDTPTLFLSHTDNPTVTAAQLRIWTWLTEHGGVTGERIQISLCERATKRESTTRTRALLFYALAVCAADGHGATRVEVPENGFTSLNLALGNDRGGVLSTRSTHPLTMRLVQNLLTNLDLDIALVNPYEQLTKGELVARADAKAADFATGAALTLSCAKLDGRVYKGGNPNWGCGLCIACLTRRASIRAAGMADRTTYLATALRGDALTKLRERRRDDLQALLVGLISSPDEFTIEEFGPYPADFEHAVAARLCQRGFAELAAELEGQN